MVTKKASKEVRENAANGAFVGFVNRRLSKEEKEQYHTWADKIGFAEVMECLGQMVENDYKLSVKRDYYGGGVQAALTCASTISGDAGLCLTARAPNMFDSLMLVFFKHSELLGGEWLGFFNVSQSPDEWG